MLSEILFCHSPLHINEPEGCAVSTDDKLRWVSQEKSDYAQNDLNNVKELLNINESIHLSINLKLQS